MKQKIVAGFVIALVLTFGACVGTAARADEPEPLGGDQCWSRCSACVYRAKGDASRKLDCYDMSAACCEANGRKPAYRVCGCH